MAWQDRIREAAYTSPSGTRLVFAFEDVRLEVTKRSTPFVFPGVDGAYVQDNGRGARSFPLRCFFTGGDHDLDAEAFVEALLERGLGRLEHPFYGTFDVVPLGQITRRDDLRDAANQTVLEVTFSESLAAVYPRLQSSPRQAVVAELEALDAAGAAQFEESADLSTVAAQEETKAKTRSLLQDVSAELAELAAATSKISDEFQDALGAVNDGIDVLIGQPLGLAQQLYGLITAPARAVTGIKTRFDGYAALIDRVTTAADAQPALAFTGGVVLPSRRRLVSNAFHLAGLLSSSALAGMIQSTLEHQFESRPEALLAAAALLDELGDLVVWLDAGFATLATVGGAGGIDTGAAYQALQGAVALAAGRLVEISFALQPERRIVLDRPRTILDLSAELYGSIEDEQLNFFIASNGFTGSEILEIPRGRTVVYYA